MSTEESRKKFHEFMQSADVALQKKYPQHIGHPIQPLNAEGTQYHFLCLKCGSWERPFPLTLTLLEIFHGLKGTEG